MNGDVYTYRKNFSVPASMNSAAEVLLVLDGVKMAQRCRSTVTSSATNPAPALHVRDRALKGD